VADSLFQTLFFRHALSHKHEKLNQKWARLL